LLTIPTKQTNLLPLDYTLGDDEIYPSLNKYTRGEAVSAGETEDEDNTPKAEPYTKKKKTGKKKKGGKKSGSKKKKSGKKKKK